MEYYLVDSVFNLSVITEKTTVAYSRVPVLQFYNSVLLQLIAYFIVSMACGGLAWQKCIGN
jgi:hypothetical protein